MLLFKYYYYVRCKFFLFMEKDETKFHGLANNHLLKDKSYHFCTALNEN